MGPDIRVYNVCTQEDWQYGKCGLAFPSKLWWRKGKGSRFGDLQDDPGMTGSMKWSYKCSCEWGYLKEEAELKPGSPAAEWYNEVQGEYGEDFNVWPRFGCKQGFRAFANGASCVMELKVGDKWQAFVSERLPPQLDDALKGRNYECFKGACARLTPREIYNALPMCLSDDPLVDRGKGRSFEVWLGTRRSSGRSVVLQ